MDRFDETKSSASTWIYTISLNLCNRHLRDFYTRRHIVKKYIKEQNMMIDLLLIKEMLLLKTMFINLVLMTEMRMAKGIMDFVWRIVNVFELIRKEQHIITGGTIPP
jgi:hypothetical protein